MKIIQFLVMVYMLSTISIFANENRNITWESLGIGIHNKGEITDWTYYGIKTPEEASLWIEALKPLGGISYAGAARLWKQNGYSADEVREWVQTGAKTPEEVSRWKRTGIKNVQELKKWQSIGVSNPQILAQWLQAGILSPNLAKQCMDKGIDEPFACEKSFHPRKIQDDVVTENVQPSLSSTNDHETYIKPTYNENRDDVLNVDSVGQVSTLETTAYQSDLESANGLGQLILLVYFIVMIITMFKGYGENRTVVIFRDYNDLGLTFLIPASFFLIYTLFMMFGGNPALGVGLALIVSLFLFFILVKSTYIDNNQKLIPTTLALMTKVPLGIIWILNLIAILDPSGKTAKQRRKNRASALAIMTILTPIIGMLVVEKEGSFFNPRDWIKGRRIGSIRKHL